MLEDTHIVCVRVNVTISTYTRKIELLVACCSVDLVGLGGRGMEKGKAITHNMQVSSKKLAVDDFPPEHAMQTF